MLEAFVYISWVLIVKMFWWGVTTGLLFFWLFWVFVALFSLKKYEHFAYWKKKENGKGLGYHLQVRAVLAVIDKKQFSIPLKHMFKLV